MVIFTIGVIEIASSSCVTNTTYENGSEKFRCRCFVHYPCCQLCPRRCGLLFRLCHPQGFLCIYVRRLCPYAPVLTAATYQVAASAKRSSYAYTGNAAVVRSVCGEKRNRCWNSDFYHFQLVMVVLSSDNQVNSHLAAFHQNLRKHLKILSEYTSRSISSSTTITRLFILLRLTSLYFTISDIPKASSAAYYLTRVIIQVSVLISRLYPLCRYVYSSDTNSIVRSLRLPILFLNFSSAKHTRRSYDFFYSSAEKCFLYCEFFTYVSKVSSLTPPSRMIAE